MCPVTERTFIENFITATSLLHSLVLRVTQKVQSLSLYFFIFSFSSVLLNRLVIGCYLCFYLDCYARPGFSHLLHQKNLGKKYFISYYLRCLWPMACHFLQLAHGDNQRGNRRFKTQKLQKSSQEVKSLRRNKIKIAQIKVLIHAPSQSNIDAVVKEYVSSEKTNFDIVFC